MARKATSKPRVTVRAWLQENKDEYKDREKLIAACMRALKVRRDAVLAKLKQVIPAGSSSSAKPKRMPGAKFTRDTFMAQFDDETATRNSIRAGLDKLTDDDILSDVDFKRMCAAPANGWRQIADEDEFVPYQFRCSGKIWWTTKATKKWALREIRKSKEL